MYGTIIRWNEFKKWSKSKIIQWHYKEKGKSSKEIRRREHDTISNDNLLEEIFNEGIDSETQKDSKRNVFHFGHISITKSNT